MTQLSMHFTLEELTFSQIALRGGMNNQPNAAQLENLKRLCDLLLEPAREMLGVPVHVDSGFRSQSVNAVVGGAIDSAHLSGRAADIIPIGMQDPLMLREAFDKLRHDSLPFDQIIIECNAWIHIAVPVLGAQPRGNMLVAAGSPGHWTYEAVA